MAIDFERRVLLFCGVGHCLTHMFMLLFPPLLFVMGETFEIGLAAVTFYITLANVCFGLGAVPAGWLADRYGDKPLLVALFVGASAGALLIGTAPSSTMLAVGAIVLGTSTSIYHPVGIGLISKIAHTPGRALGINGIYGSIGTALGPLFAALVAAALSWRWVFISLGCVSLLFGLGLAGSRLHLDHVQQRLRSPDDGPDTDRRPRFMFLVFLLFAMMCGGFHYNIILTMLPMHLAQNAKLPVGQAVTMGGTLACLALTFGAAGQFVSGLMADRFEGSRLYVINLLLIVPAVFLLGHLSGISLLIAACVAGFIMFAVQPIENTTIAAYTPVSWRSRIYGAKFVLSLGIGGTGSWIGGIITEKVDVARAFDAATFIAVLGLFFAILASLTPRRRRTGREVGAANRALTQ